MSSYVSIFNDRLAFIEFKQNILLLKQPQHKASVFVELTLDKFIEIRDFTNNYNKVLLRGNLDSLSAYESELHKIWPPLRSYPDSSKLILKALLGRDFFDI